ncbi:hypothetical protein 2200_scaffold1335_00054 [Bacteriophage sp.]|nr:hypothetical protein 2200_scaffold1335_00054 [Bacteriophage sp.]
MKVSGQPHTSYCQVPLRCLLLPVQFLPELFPVLLLRYSQPLHLLSFLLPCSFTPLIIFMLIPFCQEWINTV